MKTKICVNFSSLIVFAIFVVFVVTSAAGSARKVKPEKTLTERGYDPLELPADTRIVPRRPAGSVLPPTSVTPQQLDGSRLDSANAVAALSVADSLSGRLFRVQIFASNLFGDAKRAATTAEEIFDQPVYLDYDVPYFKVRVGNFGTRRDAEDYQKKVNTAGYPTTLVVVVNPFVRQAPALYDNLGGASAPDTSIAKDSTLTPKDSTKLRE
jgi:hypothetical protein